MNDPIEDALKNMKPAELPSALMARLTAARPQGAAKEKEAPAGLGFFRRWLLPTAVCALAAMGTVAWLNSTQSGGTSSGGGRALALKPDSADPSVQMASAPVPFESEDRIVGTREVGIVIGPNGQPIRLMEVDWMEANTVRPANGREGIRAETLRRSVVPTALEIY